MFLSTDSLECSTQHHRYSVENGGNLCHNVEIEGSKAKGYALPPAPARMFYFPGYLHRPSNDSSLPMLSFSVLLLNLGPMPTFFSSWIELGEN